MATRILGVYIADRQKEAGEAQAILTKFGCNIKTRLGLHEVGDNKCSTYGLVILELCGAKAEMDALEAALAVVEGINLQKMTF